VYFDTTLLWLLGVGTLAWFWHANLQVRERATRAARATCDADGVQFLEETVALLRMRPCRDREGRLVLCRVYQFDYSVDGASRTQGFVHFTGRRLEGVGLAGHGSAP
jgi:hypothetical protein